MEKSSLRKVIIPLLTFIVFCMLWWLPLGLGYFEVIVTALLVLVASYLEYGKDAFRSLGFKSEGFSFKNMVVTAPLIAAGLFLMYYFILIPGVTSLTGKPIDFSDFESLRGNLSATLIALPFIWISAAFGEEIIWRGYFMKQFTKLFGTQKISLIINIVLFAILFGYMHEYQGITGQIITGIIGAILALIFHYRKYNLWLNVAIHGFFDTIGLLLVYSGLSL